MIQLKKILVPTDFSDFSKPAVDYACAIAARFDSQLHLLHVVPIRNAVRSLMRFLLKRWKHRRCSDRRCQTTHRKAARKRLENNQPIVREVRTGAVFLEIIDYAKANDVDLIVIGTHGRGGLMHVLLGSVAEKIVRKSPCPVLTVKPQGHQFVMP